jgi:hypothetical protein
VDHSLDKGLQRHKIVLSNVPNDLRVSVVVGVAQYVAEIGNALPWDFGFLP